MPLTATDAAADNDQFHLAQPASPLSRGEQVPLPYAGSGSFARQAGRAKARVLGNQVNYKGFIVRLRRVLVVGLSMSLMGLLIVSPASAQEEPTPEITIAPDPVNTLNLVRFYIEDMCSDWSSHMISVGVWHEGTVLEEQRHPPGDFNASYWVSGDATPGQYEVRVACISGGEVVREYESAWFTVQAPPVDLDSSLSAEVAEPGESVTVESIDPCPDGFGDDKNIVWSVSRLETTASGPRVADVVFEEYMPISPDGHWSIEYTLPPPPSIADVHEYYFDVECETHWERPGPSTGLLFHSEARYLQLTLAVDDGTGGEPGGSGSRDQDAGSSTPGDDEVSSSNSGNSETDASPGNQHSSDPLAIVITPAAQAVPAMPTFTG